MRATLPRRPAWLLGLLLGVAACAPAPEQAGEPGAPAQEGQTEDAEEAEASQSEEPEADVETDGPAVVATVAPIADLVRQVMGDRGEVVSLVPDGADAHTYEPAPRDAAALGEADAFIGNGLGLNDASLRLAEANLPEDAPIVRLGELAASEEELVRDHDHNHNHNHDHDHEEDDDSHGEGPAPNPHLWMSVAFAIDYVGHITDALVGIDPAGEEAYRANAEAYVAHLEALDAAIAAAVDTIPADHRTLVTFHDSWAYFAPRYGLREVAAVQPSSFGEPSASEVRRVIDQIRDEGVPAVFGSAVFPSDVVEAIAAETGAEYVGDLSDDALPGASGDPEHGYVGLMLHNARTIVAALGGDPTDLDAFEPAPH